MKSYEELCAIAQETNQGIDELIFIELEELGIEYITTAFNNMLGAYHFSDSNELIESYIELVNTMNKPYCLN